jgi:hypothetical protein
MTAPGHPLTVEIWCADFPLKVTFTAPNTVFLLPLMDQRVTATLKAHYPRQMLHTGMANDTHNMFHM